MTEIASLVSRVLSEFPVQSTPDRELRGARFDAGLAFPHFRPGDGGRGLPRDAQVTVEQAFLDAGCVDWSDRNVIGLGMAAPTIHEHGTDRQRDLLRPLFIGDHIWCQLFSEPGAGSDLAGVSSRALRDGNTWIVNGQKVWTTLGHVAAWALLLARTDPDAPKHRGLSYFLLDMSLDGVEVVPLRQMTGESEFNEVYLTDVRIPSDAMVGDPGDGWQVAMTTLMNERVSLNNARGVPGEGTISRLLATYRDAAQDQRLSVGHRDRVMELYVRAEAVRLTEARAREAIRAQNPGPEGAASKLAMAELNQEIYHLATELLGPSGALIDDYENRRPVTANVHGGADLRKAFLRTRANSIEGGTSEVMRNILAERVLGLPRESAPDHDIPWKESVRP